MQNKKNPILSLQKERPLFTLLGFIFSFSLVFITFSFTVYDPIPGRGTECFAADDSSLIMVPLYDIQDDLPKPKPMTSTLALTPIPALPEPGLPVSQPEPDPSFGLDHTGSEPGFSGFASEPAPEPIPDEPISADMADKAPEFPGGTEAMQNYLRSVLVFPEAARLYGIEDVVMVSFIVEKDGRISQVQISGKNPGYDLDREALRVVKGMPRFNPGTYRKKPVRILCSLPIEFVLGE